MDDLEALLSRVPTRSAPGPSQVTYGFLKHAPPAAKLILLEGLSALLEPEGRRVSEHTSSHHASSQGCDQEPRLHEQPPPSLLDTIKRLVGRIITDRLSKAAEAKGVFTDQS